MRHEVSRVVGGKTVKMETGWIAKQASGAVLCHMEGTSVFVAAVGSELDVIDPDFLPLTVDYREKTYAAGKFPGGFIKRETRPSEKEILTMRLIDRPVRPMWPKGYAANIAVSAIVVSADNINDPDILAINASSAALTVSELPFLGPIGAVRVGRVNDQFIINPTHDEIVEGNLDLILAGTKQAICMVEAGALEISEDILVEAIQFGHEAVKELVDMQEELAKAVGKAKIEFEPVDISNIEEAISNKCGNELKEALNTIT